MTDPSPGGDAESESFELEAEPPFDPSEFALEDYVVLLVFWLLALDVFAQFFTRFVLGDSIGWTEEMARYLLIGVGFLGGAIAVRRNSHIMMEFMYRYLSAPLGRALASLVDLVNLVFFVILAWLTYEVGARTGSYMASVDIPKSIVYYVACAGFALMALRTVYRILTVWPQRFGGAESSHQPGSPENEETPR
ncbi:TRAP transporter small permease [Fodinicurvata fenggangensis]|uniref:TRAP transporter small permease n=1 Tax=Fodinicurvata fenggangensis TaxID=1121830 RepID=UPI000554BFEA|nr:TRAP transporter small permease [Fodinicurvata fenggangensis]